MLSFGWSAGDIAAAITILVKVTYGLKETGGAASQFQQVIKDFKALELALEYIEDLNPNDADFSIAQTLCTRSQSSQHVLNDFLASVAKYDKWLGCNSESKWHQGALRKTQWVLFMTKEVQKLQDIIEPQIQAINLLLQARQMKSLSRLEKLGRSNYQAIAATLSSEEITFAKSFQQVISCGETLSDQGSKQIRLLDNLDATVREIEETNTASVKHQLHAERKAEIRAASTERYLTELIHATRNLQHVTGIGHSILQDGRVNTDRQAAHMTDLLLSVKSTVESLDEEKKASLDHNVKPKAVMVLSEQDKIEQVTYQIIKLLYVIAASMREILRGIMWLYPRLVLLFRVLGEAIPRQPQLLLYDSIQFEDALGRVARLPHLYFQHWEFFDAFVQAQFKECPGERQIRSGEYLILKRVKKQRLIIASHEWGRQITPGSNLCMSVVLDKLRIMDRSCLRPLCKGTRTLQNGCSEEQCSSCGLSYHPRTIPSRMTLCQRPLCSGRVAYIGYECVTCPICSLRFFPNVVVGNILQDRSFETTPEPRITEITNHAQEVESTALSDPSLSIDLTQTETHEQTFELSLSSMGMAIQQPRDELESQLNQFRAARVQQKRLKLEDERRQSREKEEVDARDREMNDIVLLKRVHITKSNEFNDDEKRDKTIATQENSPAKRLLEARARLFAATDHFAFKTRGLIPKMKNSHENYMEYVDVISAPAAAFVGMVFLIPSEGGAFPYTKSVNHPFHGRFVVIEVQHDHSLCLHISTYGGQGTTRQNVIASDHAVIHTTAKMPYALPEEAGLNPAISVDSDDLLSELDPMSRICYSKIYNVGRGIGRRLVGYVRGGSLLRLQQSLSRCFERNHALFKAASIGHENAVKSLLAADADPDAAVGVNGNALYEATKAGHYKVIDILLARGASTYLGLGESSIDSALLQALIRQNPFTVDALLQRSICLPCKRNPQQQSLFQNVQHMLRNNHEAMVSSACKSANMFSNVNIGEFERYVRLMGDSPCLLLRPAISILVFNCMDEQNFIFKYVDKPYYWSQFPGTRVEMMKAVLLQGYQVGRDQKFLGGGQHNGSICGYRRSSGYTRHMQRLHRGSNSLVLNQ